MHPFIPTILANTALGAATTRDLMRAKPGARSMDKRGRELIQAYTDRSKEIAPNNTPVKLKIQQNIAPSGEQLLQQLEKSNPTALNPMLYASNVSDYAKGSDGKIDILKGERQPAIINTNPYADEVYFAHELGHSASTNTTVGDAIRRVRDFTQANPAMAKSIAAATLITPGVAAALTPGDDDTDEAIIGALALASPKLLDEALATKNALAIMEKSGQRANLAQRGRLAGGYLTYLAAPIVAATTANAFGNLFDENVPTV